MGLFVIGVAIICSLAIIGFVAWLSLILKDKKNTPSEMVLIENYMPRFSHGNSRGYLMGIIHGGKRSIIEFMPFGEDKELERIVILNQLMEIHPKGTTDNDFSIIKLYPPRPELLPEPIKNSGEGKYLTELIEKKVTAAFSTEVMRSQQEKLMELQLRSAGLKIVTDTVNSQEASVQDILKHIKKDDSKISVYNTGGSGKGGNN